MKTILAGTILSIATLGTGCAQVEVTQVKSDSIYSFLDVDKTPEPENGMKALYEGYSKTFRYPTEARRNNIEGKVFIYVIFDENGSITKTGIEKGLGYGMDEAALQGFKKTKLKWMPGMKDGRKVKVRYVLPFVHRLD